MEEMREQVAVYVGSALEQIDEGYGAPHSVAERFNCGSLDWRPSVRPATEKMKMVAQKRYVVEGKKDTYEQAKAFAEEVYAIPIWSTARRMPRNYSV